MYTEHPPYGASFGDFAQVPASGPIGAYYGSMPLSDKELALENSETNPSKRPIKRSVNLFVVCLCIFVPWSIFLVVSSALTFSLDNASVVVSLAGLIVFVLGYATHKYWKRLQGTLTSDDFEQIRIAYACFYASGFLFATAAVAWVAGLSCGMQNLSILRPHNSMGDMDLYVDIEPSLTRSQEIMDASRIFFKQGSHLAINKSTGFKNSDVYCVAPVSSGLEQPHEFYDYWAVGINCCSGVKADFHCGEWDNPKAYAGLRLTDDGARPYYRLAVQQAEAAYGIQAPHPIFITWMQDPIAKFNSYVEVAFKHFIQGVCIFFSVHFFLCIIVGLVLDKNYL